MCSNLFMILDVTVVLMISLDAIVDLIDLS